MEALSWVIGISAAILNTAAYLVYNKLSAGGDVKPHFGSWFVWLFMEFLHVVAILQVMGIAQSVQYMVGLFFLTTTLVVAIWKGGMTWPSKKDLAVFLVCPFVIFAMIFGNPILLSLAFLIGFTVAFYPTLLEVYINPTSEKPHAWYMWTVVFALSALNALFAWEGDIITVVNPLILCACNISIIWLCSPWLRRTIVLRRRKFAF